MKIFLDTEFSELSKDAQLISLGLIAENGKKFYAEFNDVPLENPGEWVQEHVLPHLLFRDKQQVEQTQDELVQYKAGTSEIVKHLTNWLNQFDSIEMWADVSHYDWVFFCELFGGTLHLPEKLSHRCMDLATMLRVKGYEASVSRPSLLSKDEMPANFHGHNALSDAELGMAVLKKILTE